jgi:hypothetical protein
VLPRAAVFHPKCGEGVCTTDNMELPLDKHALLERGGLGADLPGANGGGGGDGGEAGRWGGRDWRPDSSSARAARPVGMWNKPRKDTKCGFVPELCVHDELGD